MRVAPYTYVKQWRAALRQKLGEAGFKAWQRAQYRKYRERILKSQKLRFSKADPAVLSEKRKEFWKNYKAKHSDKINADRREYYARNREHTLERKRNSRNANPEATKATWRRLSTLRRARKRTATVGDLTDIAKVDARAQWWRQWFSVEVDHIVPLSRGGTHEAKNLQIIYDFENRRKYARSDYKPKVVFV